MMDEGGTTKQLSDYPLWPCCLIPTREAHATVVIVVVGYFVRLVSKLDLFWYDIAFSGLIHIHGCYNSGFVL